MKINFFNIGRDKRSWIKEAHGPLNLSAIAKEAKRGGGLMSSCVDAGIDDSGQIGCILVGGWREVGRFTIEK